MRNAKPSQSADCSRAGSLRTPSRQLQSRPHSERADHDLDCHEKAWQRRDQRQRGSPEAAQISRCRKAWRSDVDDRSRPGFTEVSASAGDFVLLWRFLRVAADRRHGLAGIGTAIRHGDHHGGGDWAGELVARHHAS